MKRRMKALMFCVTMFPTLSGCAIVKQNQIQNEKVTIEHNEPEKEYIEYYDAEKKIKKSIKKGDVVKTYYEDPKNNTIQSIINNGEQEVSVIGPDNQNYLMPGHSMLEFWENRVVKTAIDPSREEHYNRDGKKTSCLNKKGLEESTYEYYEDNNAIKTIKYYRIEIDQEQNTRTEFMEDHYYDKNNSTNYYSENCDLNEYEIYENNGLVFTCPLTYSVRVINLYEIPHLIVKDENGNTVYTTMKWNQQTEIGDSKSIYPASRSKRISTD